MVNHNLQQGAKCDGTYQRQVDLCELETILLYPASSKPAKAAYLDAVSKQTTKTNLQNERDFKWDWNHKRSKGRSDSPKCISLTGKNGEIFEKMLLICLSWKS